MTTLPRGNGEPAVWRRLRPTLIFGALGLLACIRSFGQNAPAESAPTATELSPVVVTASRSPQPVSHLPVAVALFTSEQWEHAPALTVDSTLRDDPAFSLFRRSSSLVANPTAQGVSLRGIGPSGASRSLVLLDGVPLNDPFGGWVYWSALAPATLARVEIVHGGGSSTWGSAALGGTVQVFTSPVTPGRGEVAAEIGDFGLRDAGFSAATAAPPGALRVAGDFFATEGFYTVTPSQRGAVDRPLHSSHQEAEAEWQSALDATTQLTVTGRFFNEERGNGTVLQNNRSRSGLLAATLAGAPVPGRSWTATGYVQRESFSSFFSSVSDDRASEIPANNQFNVPAAAAGGSFQTTWGEDRDASTTLGTDVRWVEGETQEDFLYTTGRFTRGRRAGGAQLFGGAFVNHERALAPDWRMTLGARVDYWRNFDGHRREFDLATGAATRDESYAAQDGVELSPSAGLVWSPAQAFRMRASAYHAFRVPTLNEYYRPFRVGDTSTDANPALRPESLDGVELGADFTPGRNTRLAVTAFANDLHNAVDNVTLASTPAGISQQRQNLDRVRVQGIEAAAEWRPLPALVLRAGWLLSDATVRRAPNQPALVGRRLAQVPRSTFTAGASWSLPDAWWLDANFHDAGRQFEDDLNTLPLDRALTWGARLSHRWGRRWEIYAAVENAFDARVETGRTANGITTLGPPRLARAGLVYRW